MEKLKPKLFSVMKTYTKQQFVKDVIAGIIVAIIALPLSIALALASGVGPEQGIYTAAVCRSRVRRQRSQRSLQESLHRREWTD